jgi:hypothetical protein
MMTAERPACLVPRSVRWALAVTLGLQLAWESSQPSPTAKAEQLSRPIAPPLLRAAALGEPIAAAQLLTLYLQAFDNQPGISIPFAELDYAHIEAWLETILSLDPRGQYPLLMASHLYAQVPDEAKRRRILDFVYRQFLVDPNRRWPWLAHAGIIAKHRLGDLPLALKYAEAIARFAISPDVPSWARQMHILLYADMGEVETAKTLLGALLASGTLSDPREIHFLSQRLRELESAEAPSLAPRR